jgi:hypothetical protein
MLLLELLIFLNYVPQVVDQDIRLHDGKEVDCPQQKKQIDFPL